MNEPDDDQRQHAAEVSTKASLYAEPRVAILMAVPLGELSRERLALELCRAYIAGHLSGMEHAWQVLADKQ